MSVKGEVPQLAVSVLAKDPCQTAGTHSLPVNPFIAAASVKLWRCGGLLPTARPNIKTMFTLKQLKPLVPVAQVHAMHTKGTAAATSKVIPAASIKPTRGPKLKIWRYHTYASSYAAQQQQQTLRCHVLYTTSWTYKCLQAAA